MTVLYLDLTLVYMIKSGSEQEVGSVLWKKSTPGTKTDIYNSERWYMCEYYNLVIGSDTQNRFDINNIDVLLLEPDTLSVHICVCGILVCNI